MGACFLYGKTGGYTGYTLPEFTYTGQYEKFQVDKKNWKIRFLTSGTLVFPKRVPAIDVFLVAAVAAARAITETMPLAAAVAVTRKRRKA